MHFLSHYYTELPVENPLHISALAIPDLTPHFSKTYNSVIKKAALPHDENLLQIHKGILSHYEADKRFHASPLFTQLTNVVLQTFIENNLDRNRLRLSVIAHLAVEMLIDRHLILENETLCDNFYKAIGHAEEKMLETYFNHFGLIKEKNSFLPNFQFFKERQFLYQFKNMERIVFGLSKIYGAVAKTEFTDEEKSRFIAALHNIDEAIRYSWQETLNREVK